MISNALKIFSGNANIPLAKEICDYLGFPLGKAQVSEFSDGEISIKLEENVRGADLFVVNGFSPPVNRNLMEMLMMIDAAKRASAERITAVIPYYGYARQDRKDRPRVPITAKLVANLVAAAGADRVLAMDLHTDQIQGFFDIQVDHLYAAPVLLQYYQAKHLHNLCVVSPDTGSVKRARGFANRVDTADLVIIDKRRPRPNESEVMNVIGNVKGKNAIIVDDMIDTAGTITDAAHVLAREGAKRIYACCTHAVLSGNAVERIAKSPIEELIVTNTMPLRPEAQQIEKIKVLSVAGLLGEAIRRIHRHESVSSLFV